MRYLESRLPTRQDSEWAGYSYRWNEDHTDAEQVESGGLNTTLEIVDPHSETGIRKQIWQFLSRAECAVCQTRAVNYVLSLTTLQLNK